MVTLAAAIIKHLNLQLNCRQLNCIVGSEANFTSKNVEMLTGNLVSADNYPTQLVRFFVAVYASVSRIMEKLLN